MSIRIWLCDLCYTQQIVSADVMPMAVGGIATFCESHVDCVEDIRVFKYPDKLIQALAGPPPHVIGFSNYCWNFELSYGFARAVKQKYPRTVVVMGGPNYAIDAPSQERFLRDHPAIDFYIMKEGEVAFTHLIGSLVTHEFNINRVKKALPGGIHAITADGRFVAAPLLHRVRDLAEIPSPYLTGKMEEFFDGVLMPILQTNRGCPFTCTFCTEGTEYFNKIHKSSSQKTAAEIDYIGRKMAECRTEGGRNDVFIADSNFGMLKEDLETCDYIAQAQEQYGWPEYIIVATGKNKKDRVLECSRKVNGAIRLSGSVQSLDGQVLENIKRANINVQQLMDLAMEANGIGANSYAEVILALPGDSAARHHKTIEVLVDAGFSTIYMFQLMLLPGTELFTPKVREQYDMRTHFRVLPKCFGHYSVDGASVITAEIEEIVTSVDTLPFEDYLECRRFNLMVTIFYNDAVFHGLLKILRHLRISCYAWIKKVFSYPFVGRLEEMIRDFTRDTREELWESREELVDFLKEEENIERYIHDELGSNLLYKYQGLATTEHLRELAEVARACIFDVIGEVGKLTPEVEALVDDVLAYEVLRKVDIFKGDYGTHYASFRHDVERFLSSSEDTPLSRFVLGKNREYQFVLDRNQIDIIERALHTFGRGAVGMSRIVSRVHMKALHRHASLVM